MSRITRSIRVHGRVQGVFFRNWTTGEARRIGLSGWVRNRSDGTVEVLASGEAAAVDEMIDLLHDGPSAAAVDRVDVEDSLEEAQGRFEKRPTV